MNFVDGEPQRRKEGTGCSTCTRGLYSDRSDEVEGYTGPECCWKGWGERREFITDGRKERTGNAIPKSIVQVNNRA